MSASEPSARDPLGTVLVPTDFSKRAEPKLLATYRDIGIRWKTLIRRGDPCSVVLAAAARSKADLIAAGTHGRSGIAHVLIGSVVEWAITAATCDVLVARPIRFSFERPCHGRARFALCVNGCAKR